MLIDKELLDRVASEAQSSPRLRMNYNLHEHLDDKAQRLLNALEPGTVLPIHRHLTTAESYVVLRGCLDVLFYSDDGVETARYELDPTKGVYGVHIPKGQWHTLEVKVPSVIFEVKDGPYVPLTEDDVLSGKLERGERTAVH